jgi:hypothetical protein
MLFNNIDKNTKLEILQEATPEYEKNIYKLLILLGIDPETFEEDDFQLDESSILPDDLLSLSYHTDLIKNIKSLAVIKKEILNLEA